MTNTVDLHEFEQSIVVRQLREDDYDRICALQIACFPGMGPWEKQGYMHQLKVFPEGQLGVEIDGLLVAGSSSLILEMDLYGELHTFDEIVPQDRLINHNPHGDTLYGIDIFVDPDFRDRRLARRMYDARKDLCRRLNLGRIVVGARIPGYTRHSYKMNVREYVEAVENRTLRDAVLTTQLRNNFVVKRIIEGYYPSDEESGGYGILLEWTNIDYQQTRGKVYRSSRPIRVSAIQYQMRPVNNFEEFASQCEFFVDTAADYNGDFIVFPELLTTQLLSFIDEKNSIKAARKLSEYTPDYLEMFSRLATDYNINIVGGSHFINEEGTMHNAAFLFHRDGRIDRQIKLHNTPDERDQWGLQPGNDIEVFDTDIGKIAILICYDIEFPEVVRLAVDKGAQVLFVPFCTDDRHGYLRVRYCAQARCIENHIYAVIAGTVGNLPRVENMALQYAQSAVLTPSDVMFARDGVAAECTPNIETLVMTDLDLELLARHKRTGATRNWLDRRFDLYEVVPKRKDTPV
ncbi:bifunctional GNAT family N-acetyltransferase/carbon-nitrogen hydrolase family protein [bacterium]|nr:bifunctional GNAT family N-acetyltransferase/carbon-nitrogen hydrolase family protein [bacterium]